MPVVRRGSLGPTPVPTRKNRGYFQNALNTCGWVLTAAGKLINECRRGTRKNNNKNNGNNTQNTRQPTAIEEFIEKVNAIRSLNIKSISNNESVLRRAFDTVTGLENERVKLEAEYHIHLPDNLGLHQQERARIYNNFILTREYIALVKGRLETALTPFNREKISRNYYEYMKEQYEKTPTAMRKAAAAAAAAAAAERFQQQATEKRFVRERVDAKFYEWRDSRGSAYQWKLKAEEVADAADSLLTRINPRIMNRTISTLHMVEDAVQKIEEYARTAANAVKEADKAKNLTNIREYINNESEMMYGIAHDKKQMWSNIWVQVETMVINASKEYARDAKAAADRTSKSGMEVRKLEKDIKHESAKPPSQPRAAPSQSRAAPPPQPRAAPPRAAPNQSRQRSEAAAKQRNANARAEAFMAQQAAKERGASDEAAKKIAQRVKEQAAEAAAAAAERKKEREDREKANAARASQNAVNAKQYVMPKTKEEAAKVLGIPVGADRKTVMKAYKEKAMLSHPDKEGGKAEWFKQVGEAFSIMKGS